MPWMISLPTFFAAIFFLMLGSTTEPPLRSAEAEVAPDRFLTFQRKDWTVDNDAAVRRSGVERTRLLIPFRGQDIVWEGIEIPVLLREHNDLLYMVGVHREIKTGEILIHRDFRYYVLDHGKLKQIRSDEFPKGIAVQNLWVGAPDVEVAVRNLDIESLSFRTSLNAQIWHELMTGKPSPSGEVDLKVLREFVQRHRPTKLKQIIKSAATQPAPSEN